MLGQGQWTVQIQPRGGGSPLFEVPWTSFSFDRAVSRIGQVNISMPVSGPNNSLCCEIVRSSEPWEHEVAIYRDRELAFVGPLISTESGRNESSLFAQDLTVWFSKRFFDEDVAFSGDLGTKIFKGMFDFALRNDPSPNITLHARDIGVTGFRRFDGKDYTPIGGQMDELARTALDYLIVGRELIIGTEVFPEADPLILHDDGCTDFTVKKDGANLGTDVAVTGNTVEGQKGPVSGRAIRDVAQYGLLQLSVVELTIRDGESADSAALSRLNSMLPIPLRVTAPLNPNAAFSFAECQPGRQVDSRLVSNCLEATELTRLIQVSIQVNPGSEEITFDLAPLGTGEEDA